MAGKNIDVGTFTFNDSNIEKQIAQNRLAMDAYALASKNSKAEIKNLSVEIKAKVQVQKNEEAQQKRLGESLKAGTITQEQYRKGMENSNIIIDEAKSRISELAAAQANLTIEINRNENAVKSLRRENGELNKLLAAGITELEGNELAYKHLNDQLDAAKIKSKNLGAELERMRQEGVNPLSVEYKELERRWKEASAEADGLNDVMKNLDASVGDSFRTVGAYQEAIEASFSTLSQGTAKLLSGDVIGGLSMVQEGIAGITTNARALYAFLVANPMTALFVGIAAIAVGIGAGIREMVKYNQEIKEQVLLVEQLTGAYGYMADEIRIRAKSLGDSFGQDFNEVLRTANALSTQMGMSFDRVFDTIQQGFIRGANAGGDFLDRLREYGPILQKYGFTLEEIVGLQIESQKSSVYSDKLEDSLKEAGLSLEEFTKAQSDALTSAFGKEFSDKISKSVNDGVLSVKDALLLMANEAKAKGLTVQELGILTADVFKGAGEDAGGAAKLFDLLYKGLDNLDEPLGSLQEKTLKLAQANEELARAKDNALKSDTIQEFMLLFETLTVKVKTVWYEFIGGILDFGKSIDDTLGITESFFELIETGREYAAEAMAVLEEFVAIITDYARELGLSDESTQGFLKTIYSFFNPLVRLKLAYEGVTQVLKLLKLAIREVRIDTIAFVNTVKTTFNQLANAVKGFDFTKPFESLKKFDEINIDRNFLVAKAAAQGQLEVQDQLNKSIKETEKLIRNTSVGPKDKSGKTGKTQAEKDAEAKAAEEARKRAEAEAKRAEAKRIADAKKAAADRQKALEDAAKKEVENAQMTAERMANIAKNELAEYILTNAKKFEDDKRLTKEKLKLQNQYLDDVLKKQKEILEAEKKGRLDVIDQKIAELNAKQRLSQAELDQIKAYNESRTVIEKEYSNKSLELDQETNEKKKENTQKFDKEVEEEKKLNQAIQYQQQLLELEEYGDAEAEVRRIQLDRETQEELQNFIEKNKLKLDANNDFIITQDEIEAARKELQTEIDAADDENERLRLQNQVDQLNLIEANAAEKKKQITREETAARLNSYGSLFGNVADLLGKDTAAGKAAALAQVAISQGLAIARIWEQKSVLPSPFGTIQKVLETGVAVANVARAANEINKVKAERGRILEGPSHSDGGIPIATPDGNVIEAEGGEAIINKNSTRLFRKELSAINEAGGGVKFASGGVVGSSLSSVQNSFSQPINAEAMAGIIADAVLEGAIIGTQTGSQKGIGEMTTNNVISNGANF